MSSDAAFGGRSTAVAGGITVELSVSRNSFHCVMTSSAAADPLTTRTKRSTVEQVRTNGDRRRAQEQPIKEVNRSVIGTSSYQGMLTTGETLSNMPLKTPHQLRLTTHE
jgi:hypothetical protein